MPSPFERRLVLPGVWGALAFGWVSFTPSLLPRGPVAQGVVAGISAAIGYGIGVVVASGWRAFADRPARPGTARAWQVTAIVAIAGSILALVVGRLTQRQVFALMGTDPGAVWPAVLTLPLALVIGVILLAGARGLRRLSRSTSTALGRHVGPRAARVLGWLTVTWIAFLVVTGLLLDGFIAVADGAFSVRDTSTADGVEPTTSALRSGGPDSLIDWDSLGRQGRSFVFRGPTAAEIGELHDGDTLEPVRVYAGLATEEDVELRAQRAVDDLERAGGFERANLLVATTTGTGWLEPGTMAGFEYLTAGDSAIVSMQYSYLPSWLSYLVDQVRARQAGRELFDAVYERWTQLPPADRPQLFVFGESLGSFGAETAFSGEFDLRNRTDGALFVGPPSFNPLHREFTEGRDAGTTQVLPTFRAGRTVRFSDGDDLVAAAADESWRGTRVLYLQHASDPITWWDTRLLLRRPDWLEEPRGSDVLDQMVWVPFVTFWQVTVDMPFAVEVPDGHGHRYRQASIEAWTAILQPPGWTDERAARLREIVAAIE